MTEDTKETISPLSDEINRIETATQVLEAQMQVLSQKLASVLSATLPICEQGEDTTPTCEASDRIRGLSNRLKSMGISLIDLIDRCQL